MNKMRMIIYTYTHYTSRIGILVKRNVADLNQKNHAHYYTYGLIFWFGYVAFLDTSVSVLEV